jgi:hypothetical protein
MVMRRTPSTLLNISTYFSQPDNNQLPKSGTAGSHAAGGRKAAEAGSGGKLSLTNGIYFIKVMGMVYSI